MTFIIKTAAFAAAMLAGVSASAAIDIVEAPTGFFVPSDALKNEATYWRSASQDWGWSHGGIAAGFTSASLNVSAFDVDFDQGEVDHIYALKHGEWVLLGALDGSNNAWDFTTFTLDSSWFDDIVAGLQVRIDIDVNDGGWRVTLGKSTLTTDGTGPGNPTPGIPEPASWAMMIAGFGLVGSAMRRRSRMAVSRS